MCHLLREKIISDQINPLNLGGVRTFFWLSKSAISAITAELLGNCRGHMHGTLRRHIRTFNGLVISTIGLVI